MLGQDGVIHTPNGMETVQRLDVGRWPRPLLELLKIQSQTGDLSHANLDSLAPPMDERDVPLEPWDSVEAFTFVLVLVLH